MAYARTLLPDTRSRLAFERMAERSGILSRFSCLPAGDLARGEVDATGFYRPGAFPTTAARMRRYEREALPLALAAARGLPPSELATVTHLVVASCTGFSAPGLDLQLAQALDLRPDVQRTTIGFMGCAAAMPALRLARATVRSEPDSVVLVVCCELCSLHLQESPELGTVLSFLLFADGAAAALVSARPQGLALEDFRTQVLPDSAGEITWHVGDGGFDMHLSGQVPLRIASSLRAERARPDAHGLLRGDPTTAVDLWAVHPGGRTVLDAVAHGLALPEAALDDSRAVLEACGNMSSATVMFVLARMLRRAETLDGARGLAVAFGPGMVAESLRFRVAA